MGSLLTRVKRFIASRIHPNASPYSTENRPFGNHRVFYKKLKIDDADGLLELLRGHSPLDINHWLVRHATLYRSKSGSRHEYIVAWLELLDDNGKVAEKAVIKLERSSDQQEAKRTQAEAGETQQNGIPADGPSTVTVEEPMNPLASDAESLQALPASVAPPSPPSRSSSPVPAADHVTYGLGGKVTSPPSEALMRFQFKRDAHFRLEQLLTMASVLSRESTAYNIVTTQCNWFAGMLWSLIGAEPGATERKIGWGKKQKWEGIGAFAKLPERHKLPALLVAYQEQWVLNEKKLSTAQERLKTFLHEHENADHTIAELAIKLVSRATAGEADAHAAAAKAIAEWQASVARETNSHDVAANAIAEWQASLARETDAHAAAAKAIADAQAAVARETNAQAAASEAIAEAQAAAAKAIADAQSAAVKTIAEMASELERLRNGGS